MQITTSIYAYSLMQNTPVIVVTEILLQLFSAAYYSAPVITVSGKNINAGKTQQTCAKSRQRSWQKSKTQIQQRMLSERYRGNKPFSLVDNCLRFFRVNSQELTHADA